MTDTSGLMALEARLRQDLAFLDLPAKPWLPERGPDHPHVAIIGAGMAGLAAAGALRLLGIPTILVDQAPAGQEGPWATTARMETLRSPKQLAGPALGLPALTFRAWFEAQFGLTAWEELDKIPRVQWAEYLRWYRQVLDLQVRNEHRVLGVRPHAAGVTLNLSTPEGDSTLEARRVIIATGRAGLGGPSLPAFVKHLPTTHWSHTGQPLSDAAQRGLRIGVVGAGASAMDAAATALEAGAASVDLLIRRADLPRVNKGKGAGSPGLLNGYWSLPDREKWRLRHYINQQQVPPPRGSTLRVSRHSNARFHFTSPVLDVELSGSELKVRTPQRTLTLDHLILGTGYRVDWQARPEFAPFADQVRSWSARYQPGEDEGDAELESFPDLGPHFEFQPGEGADCPGLERLHCFCYPATLSHGSIAGDIPAISNGAQRLAQALAGLLYIEDLAWHGERLAAYAEPELNGDEWTPFPPTAALP